MRLVDLFPLKGTFKPGEGVSVRAVVWSEDAGVGELRLNIFHFDIIQKTITQQVRLQPGLNNFTIDWQPYDVTPRGYGLVAELVDEQKGVIGTANSAFDVLESWTSFPRYGFLTDFSPGRNDIEETITSLLPYHINALQFYDWQYRHDRLISPTTDYVDPLRRELSLGTVRACIEASHKAGLAAMPYLAVYAASMPFWEANPAWALYDEEGKALAFMDFLGIMNPAPGSPWMAHLHQECAQVLTVMPFDGLHVDQYGDPKEGFDSAGQAVNIPEAFSSFIHSLKGAHPEAAVTFNAVGNWPIKVLAKAPQDFIYIEIWPPKTRYLDIAEIVLNARRLSGGKAVVIALYLPEERTANIRLADAIMFSCGGVRIEIGEKDRLLTDPYFPNHQPVTDDLKVILKNYYDFAVRYQELFGPMAGEECQWAGDLPRNTWSVARRSPDRLTLCLVNFNGIDERDWDKGHASPVSQMDLLVSLFTEQPVDRVLWASPDCEVSDLHPINWTAIKNEITLVLPELDYWAILVIEFE